MIIVTSNKKSQMKPLISHEGEGINIDGEPLWTLNISVNHATFVQLVEKEGDEIKTFCAGKEPDKFKGESFYHTKGADDKNPTCVAFKIEWDLDPEHLIDESADLVHSVCGALDDSGDQAARTINLFYEISKALHATE